MKRNRNKILPAILAAVMLFQMFYTTAWASGDSAFELIGPETSETLGGTIYYYKHKKTGAQVIYNENHSDKREFAMGFKTPPIDSKGANHVLEHALFCGSEKYPIKNIMHYIQNGSSSLVLNGVTADDCTYYLINTRNQTEYYNMMDVYLNGIFHPLFLTDENIFRQQGIRIEYVNGKAQYNGVVYNELRIKNLNTEENSVNFLADKLYKAIYGDTAPAFSAGGELDAIKELTYDDLLRVYNTYYIPSNSMTYLSGNQDIQKTLAILDGFFSENDTKAPDISFEDTKKIPAEPIRSYNIDGNTKTVDIGFMSSGVPASAGANERYARDILFEIIKKEMETETNCSDMYISGGNSGGISNLALMLSKIPVEKKDEIISAYSRVLEKLSADGIDEKEIDVYIEKQQEYFYASWENVFTGLLYQSDPLAYTEINSVCDYLKNHKEYFNEILRKYFTDNPYSTIIISGNGSFGSEDSSINVSDEALEKIKLETENFQKWNDKEDAPEIIDKIPFLTLSEVKTAPEKQASVYEKQNGFSFYHTNKEGSSLSLYFPLDVTEDDFDYLILMNAFLQNQAEKTELEVYTALSPLEQEDNPQEINPHFHIGLSAENLQNLMSFLQSETLWNADDLADYIKETPDNILNSYYDPYFFSYEMKNSALSAGRQFSYLTGSNTIIGGSPHYYHFLQSLDPQDAQNILVKIKELANHIIFNARPITEYIGDDESYKTVKKTIIELFADGNEHKSGSFHLPLGYYSAATITKLADANHFMITANYDQNEYSGKLAVLGKVLSAKYITPTMRGKHGAYGSRVSFYDDGMVSSVTGIADIDLTIEVWKGMGDYLRTINLTQKELDAFIVSAVEEFDEWDYKVSEYGAETALQGKSAETYDKIRNEMLSTTVADIKDCADFVDKLVNQMRIFAVLGKSAADSAEFDFAYYGNADTLEVTPRLKKHPDAYIQGKTENTFCPDDYITRAETAALIDRIISDPRNAQNASPFSDIAQQDWFYNPVVSLSEKGVINGYDNGTFQPENHITRAELSAILSKFIYEEASDYSMHYSDVSQNDWFYAPLCKMVKNGYITGYGDNTLRPKQPVTRAEAVTIMNRMLHLTNSSVKENPFADVDSSHWAYNDILAAVIN